MRALRRQFATEDRCELSRINVAARNHANDLPWSELVAKRGGYPGSAGTLGHDDRTHNLAAYKQFLANTRTWLLNRP